MTTDDRGFVKYWQSNFNNVHTFQAHADPVKCSRWEYSCHVTTHCIIRGVSDECAYTMIMFIIDQSRVFMNELRLFFTTKKVNLSAQSRIIITPVAIENF